MGWVAFIVAGGVGVPTAVFLVARHLVEKHADDYAATVRRVHARPRTAERPKELIRR